MRLRGIWSWLGLWADDDETGSGAREGVVKVWCETWLEEQAPPLCTQIKDYVD